MTRSTTVALSRKGYAFDRVGRSRNFACTAQRGIICLLTKKGSDPLFPEAGTSIPKMAGVATLQGEGYVGQQVALAKSEIAAHLKKYPTDYAYEGVEDLKITPEPLYPDRLNVFVQFISPENIRIGMPA
jgi:hypothetical protein